MESLNSDGVNDIQFAYGINSYGGQPSKLELLRADHDLMSQLDLDSTCQFNLFTKIQNNLLIQN